MLGLRTVSIARAGRCDPGVLALLIVALLLLPAWTPRLYATDSVQYYAYLRSLLFDGDFNFLNEYQRFHELNPHAGIDRALLPWRDPATGQWRNLNPTTGLPVNIAPVGSAILWAPAVLLAHAGVVLARALGSSVPADGYSQPYIAAVCAASWAYGLLGVLLSYRIARRLVGVWPAALATLVCWLASPVVFYMYVSPAWSHTASLFATTLFIWYWLRVRPAPTPGQWLLLGLLGGLMVLTREQLGLFLLLPALDALRAYLLALHTRDWPLLVRLLRNHLLFVLVLALTLLPQLATYRVLNGHWGPARTVAQKFNWLSPHFIDTLVDLGPSPVTGRSLAHGALLWTPAWALALIGLLLFWQRQRWLAALLLIAVLAQVWINGSFGTTWHLSGAFGFRRLIEATPIFVLGLAWLIERVRMPRVAWSALALALIAWNVGLIAQWTITYPELRRGLVWDGMLRRQLAVPVTLLEQGRELLHNRAQFYQNDGVDR